MRGIIFYRRNSESESAAERYKHDFERFTGKELELMDVDSREGADLATIYDIVRYPAILTLDDEGRQGSHWQGIDELPRLDDVAGYL